MSGAIASPSLAPKQELLDGFYRQLQRIKPCFTTRRGRLILFFLTLFAGVSIVTTALIRVQDLSPESATELTWSQFKSALILASFACMHVLYMLLVVQSTVLDPIQYPREPVDIAKRYLAIALCMAYASPLLVYLSGLFYLKVTGGAAAASLFLFGPSSKPSKLVALFFFFIVYCIWLGCEIAEVRSAGHDSKRAKDYILSRLHWWLAIEILSIVAILYSTYSLFRAIEPCELLPRARCLHFYEGFDTIGQQISFIEPKDVFVGFCLGFFLLLRIVKRTSSPPTELFCKWYGDYVRATRVVEVESALPIEIQAELASKLHVGQVLDFGCGDGVRLKQFLGVLGDLSASRMIGVDHNAIWRASFEFGKENFHAAVPANLATFDVLHLSHVLYEPDATKAAVKLIKERAEPGALIIVRGASANSATFLLSVALASRVLTYHPHHHWTQMHLRKLIADCNLVPVAHAVMSADQETPTPTMRLRQLVSIDEEATLSAVLGAIFPDARGFTSDVLNALQRSNVRNVPIDDDIYIFRCANNGKRGSSTK